MKASKHNVTVGTVLVRKRYTNGHWHRDRTVKITCINGDTIQFMDLDTHVMDWFHAYYIDAFDIQTQDDSSSVIGQVMCELMHDIDRMQLEIDEKKRKLAILKEATTILRNGV